MHRSTKHNIEPRNIPTKMLNQFLTKVCKQFTGGRIIFSTKDARVIGHP